MTSLETEISRLSVSEKFDLLDSIWADLSAQTMTALDGELLAELDQRVSHYEANPVDASPGSG